MITLAIGVVGQVFRVTVTCEEFRAQSTKDGTVQPGKYHGFVAPVARAQTSLTNSLVSSCGDERREDEEGLIVPVWQVPLCQRSFCGVNQEKSGTEEITTNCLEMAVCCTKSVSLIIITILKFGKEDFPSRHFT